jgi:hypothetical protein
MRRFILAAAGVAVLASAGLAAAMTMGPPKSDAISGTFGATNATRVSTKTCTTSDGRTVIVSQGTYTGMSGGSAELAGPIALAAHATIDSTAGLGVVTGHLRIDVPGRDTTAAFTGVYDHGKLAGLLSGQSRTPGARVLGNMSADSFSAAGGFSGGKIGGGTAGGSAIKLGPTKCAKAKPQREESAAVGTVSSITGTSITVAGLTCSMSGMLATKAMAALKTGDRAEIHCRLVNGANTLFDFKKRK